MTIKKYIVLSGFVGVLGLSGCGSPPAESEQGEAARLLAETGAIERLAERSTLRAPGDASAPSFVVDPGWPKPLPNNWRIQPGRRNRHRPG